ncbi:MAG: GIY-YIG nuclease family protein [Methylococcales bacterium]|nr:GIY-YIG nuclease family protein [Methylococcales bacterium]MDD5753921.1 GIY-YIG nuclease family protein [Methylococcales bacterium]
MKLIYIIENGSRHKKIGVTSNIQKRIAQLNTAISTGIRSVIVSDFVPNAYTLEKQLHEANKEHRLNGEWFREIVDFCGIEFSYAERGVLKNKDFFFMFQSEHLTKLALNQNLRISDYRLMLFLFGHLDFENYISITQKQISAVTKIGQAEISKSLKRLEEQAILTKEKKGNRNVYRLNSSYAWKGKISEFQKEEKDRKKRAASEAKIVQLKQKVITDNEPPTRSD